MKFRDVASAIEGVPFTSPERGRELYDFVLEHRPQRCLELGFAHGVSLAYVAAALDELGAGHVDGVDLLSVPRDPSAEELLQRCGLSRYVTLHREQTSYTWWLKKRIEARSSRSQCAPEYDLVFVDGPKNWTIDGAAFFMADKLLKPQGTIVFDDYSYAYGDAGCLIGTGQSELGEDEKWTPHVKAIFDLLVQQHPDYGAFRVSNEQLVWATKTGGANRVLTVQERIGLREKALRAVRKWKRG